MAAAIRWLCGTSLPTPWSGNVAGAGLSNLANNGLVGSSGIDAASGDLSLFAEVCGEFVYNTPPTLNSGISVWFLRAITGDVNGPSYEIDTASGNFTPARLPDVVLPLMSTTGFQRVINVTTIPPGGWKVYAKNDGTGQTIASGDIILRPLTYNIV